MRVLIGHSYFLRFDPKLDEARRPYAPLGTLLAAAQARDGGHDVTVFDAMLEPSTAGWSDLLDSTDPDVAVLFEDNFNYLSKMCLLNMRDAAFEMIDAAASRGVPVYVCGSDATDNAAMYLGRGALVVIDGEGDATLVELLGHAPGDLEPATVAGVSYLGSDGAVNTTQSRPNLKDLDALPLPAWDLVDVDRYLDVWRRAHGTTSWSLVTTRGCPYHCNWCAKPIWGQRYNARSPHDVVEEIAALRDAVGPDHLWFADDIFGLKPGWITTFADEVTRRGLTTPFTCLSRPDLIVRGDTARELARAGCDIVWIGAESGSQRILDAMEKGTTVEQIQEAADAVHDAGFRIGFFLQFGYPGEGRDDIEQTLELVRRARPDDIGMSVAYPLPGTPFSERVAAELGDVRHWRDSNDLAMLFEGPFTTEFYRQLHTTLHREYRPRRTFWQLTGRSAGRPGVRQVASALRDLALLPRERLRLRRLCIPAAGAVGELPVALDPAEAAEPTPQPVAAPTRDRRSARGR